MFEKKNNKRYFFFISILLFLFLSFSASAFERGSANYRIEMDSINAGGLDVSSSTNYRLKDTIGEIATGDASSTNYNLHAGYRQMDESYISITVPGNITLTPSIGGLTGGTADGNGTWTVQTDSESGYSMSIRASNTPAMQYLTNSFPDYTPNVAGIPDIDFTINPPNYEFGFSPYNPSSIVTKFKSNGTTLCNTGSNHIDGDCWLGLTTANTEIVNRSGRTLTGGENTKINFRAEVIAGGHQAPGNYVAPIIITAATN